MNRDMAWELVLRSYPTDNLDRFIEGYIMALEDVKHEITMMAGGELAPEKVVEAILFSVETTLEQVTDTREALQNKNYLPDKGGTLVICVLCRRGYHRLCDNKEAFTPTWCDCQHKGLETDGGVEDGTAIVHGQDLPGDPAGVPEPGLATDPAE